jgi:N-ethylmaleimide reductase
MSSGTPDFSPGYVAVRVHSAKVSSFALLAKVRIFESAVTSRSCGDATEQRGARDRHRIGMLFDPTTLGPLSLQNRIVMAPMTRSRSLGNVPGELVATYYAQRASAGLIITEGTSPSPNGLGYARIPGLFSKEQSAGWKRVTQAVHAAGGKIAVQLMHTGRVTHPANLPKGARSLAPSPLAAPGEMWTDAEGSQPFPPPEAMTSDDIEAAIEEYAVSGALAIEAGFDAVELHGANGYLIEQFLNTGANQRTDAWGGSIDGRLKFVLAVVDRLAARIGANRVGIRLSPYGAFNGMQADAQTDALYTKLAEELSARKILYVHLVDHSSMGAPKPKPELVAAIRHTFKGALILSGGYDKGRAEADLVEKRGDLVAFGRPFVANPNLPDKLRRGAPLREADQATLYTPGEKGYTDYPAD